MKEAIRPCPDTPHVNDTENCTPRMSLRNAKSATVSHGNDSRADELVDRLSQISSVPRGQEGGNYHLLTLKLERVVQQ